MRSRVSTLSIFSIVGDSWKNLEIWKGCKKLPTLCAPSLNDSHEDSEHDADGLIVTDGDADGNNSEKLSDQDVLKHPIHCLKPEDLQHCKKLQHCIHQERYLQNLIKKKGSEYL